MTQLPQRFQEFLEEADRETLEATIDFAEAQLTETLSQTDDESPETPLDPPEEFGGDEEAWDAAVEDCDAPGRATLTTKRINENEYLYWQWSEDGTTKSEYIAPKNPSQ